MGNRRIIAAMLGVLALAALTVVVVTNPVFAQFHDITYKCFDDPMSGKNTCLWYYNGVYITTTTI